ncbi:MAG: alkaline phosphatase D family protein [Pseudomonadota bacterium]
MEIDRRKALFGLTSALILPRCVAADLRGQSFSNEVFLHGVASGDPAQDSVVLWTRVSGQSGEVAVDWSVATDPGMRNTVTQGTVHTSEIRDYTVKVIPEGLPEGTQLYYRFVVGGVVSPVGRTRTLPTGEVDSLVIAVASCSNYPFGRFNGYQAIADDPDVDIVVHLGDYIYEYDENGYGADAGRALGRVHEPRHETVTLSDYRIRHAQYKSDSGSLAMHAMHPLIATWDDHESANNPWSGGAQNHQDGEGEWIDRRSISLRAYYEWMPVREPGVGESRESRRAHFRFGDLASLFAVETRHMARSEQIDLGANEDSLTSPEAAAEFYKRVVGDESREMMSQSDETFLAEGLKASVEAGQPWRVLANQTILARVVAAPLNDPVFLEATESLEGWLADYARSLIRVGELEIPANMDAWDGYPAARERLYALAAAAGARDLLVVTGDTHVFWQNRLNTEAGEPAGLELGTSGISSPRGLYELGDAANNRHDELLVETNDSVEWMDGRYRGFVKLTLEREKARAEFVGLSTIETRSFDTAVIRFVDIVRRDGRLDYV